MNVKKNVKKNVKMNVMIHFYTFTTFIFIHSLHSFLHSFFIHSFCQGVRITRCTIRLISSTHKIKSGQLITGSFLGIPETTPRIKNYDLIMMI